MDHNEVVSTIRSMVKNGDVKTKGAYEVLPHTELGWHKNHSAMIVSMAALSEILGLKKAEGFILDHRDPYDFFLRTKVPRSSKLVLVDEFSNDQPLQNICRYYPSTAGGGKLVKLMPALPGKESEGDRRLSIDKEWDMTPCNNMVDFSWNINYDYYISEAKKLVDAILGESDIGEEIEE